MKTGEIYMMLNLKIRGNVSKQKTAKQKRKRITRGRVVYCLDDDYY